MTGEKVTVAAVQLTSGSNPQTNVDAAIGLIEEAIRRGAEYVQLPEYFNYLGPSRSFEAAAESIPGPTTLRLAQLARSHGVAVHIGSMLETSNAPQRFFNTSVVIDGPERSRPRIERRISSTSMCRARWPTESPT